MLLHWVSRTIDGKITLSTSVIRDYPRAVTPSFGTVKACWNVGQLAAPSHSTSILVGCTIIIQISNTGAQILQVAAWFAVFLGEEFCSSACKNSSPGSRNLSLTPMYLSINRPYCLPSCESLPHKRSHPYRIWVLECRLQAIYSSKEKQVIWKIMPGWWEPCQHEPMLAGNHHCTFNHK